MASFADVHLYLCWHSGVGGSEKVQNYADVVYGWSLKALATNEIAYD